MQRGRHGTLFDFGGVAAGLAAAAALAIALLQIAALAYINARWPAVPMEQIRQEAVARAQAGLRRIDRPNMLLQVDAATVQRFLAPQLQAAVDRLNAQRTDLRLQVTDLQLRFEGQHAALAAGFELQLLEHGLRITGRVEGLGFVAIDGSTLTVRPALDALKVRDIRSESGGSWWMPAVAGIVFAQLQFVRDNLNGQLHSYTQSLPVAPLTLPGEPRGQVPLSFPDPFRPGQNVTATFVPPVLKGVALLADAGRVTVLAELSLDDAAAVQPPGQGGDFGVFRREFAQRLAASGLKAAPQGDAFDVDARFLSELFRRTVGQVYTRDRVALAVKESYEALPRLAQPALGVSLDGPTVAGAVREQMHETLVKWASSRSGTVTTSTFELRPQHFWARASAAFELPQAGARLRATVALAVPAAGLQSGVRLYPAIDELRLEALSADSFGDLAGLLRGINVFLAGAVGAANAALQPFDAGVDPLKLGTVNFASMANASLAVTPSSYTPRPLALGQAAVLIDADRILVMADALQGAAAQPAPAAGDFEAYRRAYHARWSAVFGDPARPGTAHAYVRTAVLADYLNAVVNEAGVAITASLRREGSSVESLVIDRIPAVRCKDLLDCPDRCRWWDAACHTWRPICNGLNETARAGCNLWSGVVRKGINELVSLLGNRLGDLKVDVRADATARAGALRLAVAPDLGAVDVSLLASAEARASADIAFHAKSVSGRLVCPFNFHHRVPPVGEIHARVPQQPFALASRFSTETQLAPDGNWKLAMRLEPQADIPISGALDTSPYLQLRLAMLSMNIQCPATNALNLIVPGLGAALAFLDIGQIGAAVTDQVAQNVVDGLPPELKLIYLGRYEGKIDKPSPVNFELVIPPVRVGGRALRARPEIRDGLIQVHLDGKGG